VSLSFESSVFLFSLWNMSNREIVIVFKARILVIEFCMLVGAVISKIILMNRYTNKFAIKLEKNSDLTNFLHFLMIN
jgi:hypothetical protein